MTRILKGKHFFGTFVQDENSEVHGVVVEEVGRNGSAWTATLKPRCI
jgi:hypothetical protein